MLSYKSFMSCVGHEYCTLYASNNLYTDFSADGCYAIDKETAVKAFKATIMAAKHGYVESVTVDGFNIGPRIEVEYSDKEKPTNMDKTATACILEKWVTFTWENETRTIRYNTMCKVW